MSEGKYRFPGVDFFKTIDEDIFYGREKNVAELSTQIMTSQTVILHGESGTGKSSMVNAGLIPYLKKSRKNMLCVSIRLKSKNLDDRNDVSFESDDDLVSETLDCIDKDLQSLGKKLTYYELPYLSSEISEKDLWHKAKILEKNNITLLLIFDQFEEFQNYSFNEIKNFKIKLFELLSSEIPEDIYNEIIKNTEYIFKEQNLSEQIRTEYNKNMEFLKKPVSARVLFVVREDRLGTMSLLCDYLTDILKNQYQLLPLIEERARESIEKPASMEGDFRTKKFQFESDALDKIIKYLKDRDTGRVDPLQIQIVCSRVEKKIESKEIL